LLEIRECFHLWAETIARELVPISRLVGSDLGYSNTTKGTATMPLLAGAVFLDEVGGGGVVGYGWFGGGL